MTFFDTAALNKLSQVEVGVLPDMLIFTPDGKKLDELAMLERDDTLWLAFDGRPWREPEESAAGGDGSDAHHSRYFGPPCTSTSPMLRIRSSPASRTVTWLPTAPLHSTVNGPTVAPTVCAPPPHWMPLVSPALLPTHTSNGESRPWQQLARLYTTIESTRTAEPRSIDSHGSLSPPAVWQKLLVDPSMQFAAGNRPDGCSELIDAPCALICDATLAPISSSLPPVPKKAMPAYEPDAYE